MKSSLEDWTQRLLEDNPKDICGWAVCIVGTVRSAWLNVDGDVTRRENEAARFITRGDASILMNGWFNRDRTLWKYMRLIPVSETQLTFYPFNGLPTHNGK